MSDETTTALQRLADAADLFAADQGRATDKRVGLVQPVSVAECDELRAAVSAAYAVLEKPSETTTVELTEQERKYLYRSVSESGAAFEQLGGKVPYFHLRLMEKLQPQRKETP